MARRLINFATFLSLLVLITAAGLWARSFRVADTISFRSSWSYARGPATKWVVLRTGDGLHFRFFVAAPPAIDPGLPPWRVAPPGQPRVRYLPRAVRGARPLTPEESRDFESEVGERYRAAPVVRWRQGGPLSAESLAPARAARSGGTFWRRAGFEWAAGDYYASNLEETPGVLRVSRAAVPFGAVILLAAGPLTARGVGRLARRVGAARRRRRGLCPACGYDLRASPDGCPECGHAPAAGPAAPPAARPRWDTRVPWLGRPRRWPSPSSVAAVATVAALIAVLARRYDPPAAPRDGEAHRQAAETLRLRADLDAKLGAVAREAARLRAAGDAAGAEALEAELASFRARAAGGTPAAGGGPAPGGEPELHVVGVYEGDVPAGARRESLSRPRGTVVVEVHDAGRSVVLGLCAYEPVTWDLRLDPGVRLGKIVLGGYHDQDVVGVPPGVGVEEHTHDGGSRDFFYAHRRREANFERAAAVLRKVTGHDVCTFQGRYRPGGAPFVLGPRNRNWEAQRLVAEIAPLHRRAAAFELGRVKASLRSRRFTALLHHAPYAYPQRTVVTEFDPTGPLAPITRPFGPPLDHLAVDPAGPTYYAADQSGRRVVTVRRENAGVAVVPFDDRLMPFSRCGGLAFDSRRRRLLVVEHPRSPAGARLLTYSPDQEQWGLLGTLGYKTELAAVTYSAEHDCYYALTASRADAEEPVAVTRLSPDGVALWRVPLADLDADEAIRHEPAPPPQLVAVGPHLAVIVSPRFESPAPDAPPRAERRLLIDPLTGEVIYSDVPDGQAPPPTSSRFPGD